MPTYKERTPAIYRCKFLGTDERLFTNTETNEEEPRWIWRFQELNDPTSVGQIDKITGTSLKSPNSNAYKMAAGIMGRKLEAGDDTDSKVGQIYDVVYGPNQAGNLTITSVVPVYEVKDAVNVATMEDHAKGRTYVPAGLPPKDVVPADSEDLPF